MRTGSIFIDNFVTACHQFCNIGTYARSSDSDAPFRCFVIEFERILTLWGSYRLLLPVGSALSCAFTQWLTSTLRTGLCRLPACLWHLVCSIRQNRHCAVNSDSSWNTVTSVKWTKTPWPLLTINWNRGDCCAASRHAKLSVRRYLCFADTECPCMVTLAADLHVLEVLFENMWPQTMVSKQQKIVRQA